jgi:release factor glutamine methyltransferase
MADTLQNLLEQATQQLSNRSDSARLDAEVLMAHCLQRSRSFLRAWPEHRLSEAQADHYRQLIGQRCEGMPVAYLTGSREFWSREFLVNPDVLIPRADSELLIELSLQRIDAQQSARILDLGTGSGILAITLAAERRDAMVFAVDASRPALNVARANAERMQVDNVHFLCSDWLQGVQSRFDLIISNPPYIDADDPHLLHDGLPFEPQSALISAENGLRDLRLIAEQARDHLAPQAWLLMEHGFQQGPALQKLLNSLNYQHVATFADLSGHPRVTGGLWNAS